MLSSSSFRRQLRPAPVFQRTVAWGRETVLGRLPRMALPNDSAIRSRPLRRRYLSTGSTTTSTGSGSRSSIEDGNTERPNKMRQRRRRRRPLKNQSGTTTLRDRMRLLSDQNLVEGKLTSRTADRLLAVAQGRLEYLRDRLFGNWNPDYKSSSAAGGGAGRQLLRRPLQHAKGPIMDGRWWLWNVLWALTPAVVIGLYCEFRGQHLMHEYHVRQELAQAERIMGREFVERHRDALATPPPEPFWIRAWQALAEVVRILPLDALLRGSDGGDGGELRPADRPSAGEERAPISTRTTGAPDAPATARDNRAAAVTAGGAKMTPPSSSSISASPLSEAERESLEARIRKLEAALLSQQQQKEGPLEEEGGRHPWGLGGDPAPPAMLLRYRIERETQQSGIQNRMEDAQIDRWKDRIRNVEERERAAHEGAEKSGTSSTAPSWVQKALAGTKESLDQARRKWIQKREGKEQEESNDATIASSSESLSEGKGDGSFSSPTKSAGVGGGVVGERKIGKGGSSDGEAEAKKQRSWFRLPWR